MCHPSGCPKAVGIDAGSYSAAMTPEEFRKHGHDMVDWIAEFLEHGVAEQRVFPETKPGDIRAQLPEHPPVEPESFDASKSSCQG